MTKAHYITLDGRQHTIPKPAKTAFTRTNNSVDWASWTWNPVTGCLHECHFCYAREIANSPIYAKIYPFKFDPTFIPHRLDAPRNTKRPDTDNPKDGRVFVGSMADLFGKWVPDEWIKAVFDACMQSPEWQYMFLTKWPARYRLLEALPNALFGASVVRQADVARIERDMQSFTTSGKKWISLEPMLEPIRFNNLSWCDFIAIGAQTSTNQLTGKVPAFSPRLGWVLDVTNQARQFGVKVFWKQNLLTKPGIQLPDFDI